MHDRPSVRTNGHQTSINHFYRLHLLNVVNVNVQFFILLYFHTILNFKSQMISVHGIKQQTVDASKLIASGLLSKAQSPKSESCMTVLLL